MENIVLKVKKVREGAILPFYGTDYSAGFDLHACLKEDLTIFPGDTVFINTGLAMEIPVDYAGFIYARSGISCKRGLAPANKVGVIDADYRGEIIVALYNHSRKKQIIEVNERIAQMVIMPFLKVAFEEVDFLESTERGEGKFGSTGRK